jgi:hypothetical protein
VHAERAFFNVSASGCQTARASTGGTTAAVCARIEATIPKKLTSRTIAGALRMARVWPLVAAIAIFSQ